MKALIVIDMQNDFVDGALGSAEAQAIVPNVVEKVRTWPMEDCLAFTRDTHYDHYMTTLEGQLLPVPHCIKDTDGWQIIDELLPYAEESDVIDKETFGYEFWANTRLEECDEIHLCGLCTDICVVSNALALRMFYPDMPIIVDASCCAGVTPEKHLAALEVMKSCQIEVINE
jgi:nicotinamidase-related amidase